MYRGLVVGKFMPLHRGHQLLIESGLARVDDLTVVMYDSSPEGHYPAMPMQKRWKWLIELYPQLENIVPRHDILPADMLQKEKDEPKWAQAYADDLKFLGKFDFVFSSENYGEAFAEALGAKNIVVDAARELVPISGTEIRENIYEHRGWLDPIVYRSLIQKVVFVGTESTGKSTLARAMAEEFDTLWVHEYGRELWEKQGLTGSFADMLKIATNQYRREQAATLHSRDYLFCDTNSWTTLQWNLMYDKTYDARLWELVEKTKDEYIWIFCDNDFAWVDDGTRELKNGNAEKFQEQIYRNLCSLGVDFQNVTGSLDERANKVKQILATY